MTKLILWAIVGILVLRYLLDRQTAQQSRGVVDPRSGVPVVSPADNVWSAVNGVATSLINGVFNRSNAAEAVPARNPTGPRDPDGIMTPSWL